MRILDSASCRVIISDFQFSTKYYIVVGNGFRKWYTMWTLSSTGSTKKRIEESGEKERRSEKRKKNRIVPIQGNRARFLRKFHVPERSRNFFHLPRADWITFKLLLSLPFFPYERYCGIYRGMTNSEINGIFSHFASLFFSLLLRRIPHTRIIRIVKTTNS